MPRRVFNGFRGIGHHFINGVWRLGYASRFFMLILLKSGTSFRRFHLTIREIFFTGVLSLIIIAVSGLFVGMVPAAGLRKPAKYGSSDAVGTLVALSLTRSWPVVAALCSPAARLGDGDRPDEGHRAISAMEMMAVDPIARVIGPASGEVFYHRCWPPVQRGGVTGYLIAMVRSGGRRRLLVPDAGGGGLAPGRANGVIKSLVFGVAVTAIALFEGYDAPPTAEGVSGATTRTVVTSSLAILGLDFILTAFMFTGV